MTSADSGEAGAETFQRDIVVIGASAGGVEALTQIIRQLPGTLGAAVFVVLHVPPTGTSVLPQILERSGSMPASPAEHGQAFEHGHIYVAPADHHMLLEDRGITLTRAPRENGHRPAVDPLFRSAARAHGPRVIGVLLSGANDDGTAGLQAVKLGGGATLVQDPADALYPTMPRSAIRHGTADHVASVAQLPDELRRLVDTPVEKADNEPGKRMEAKPSQPDRADRGHESGEISGLTCPECGGALWETHEGDLARFRCHVGHAYSPSSLETDQAQALEMALWAALRSLQERGDLFRRLARRSAAGRRFLERAEACDEHAAVLRRLITTIGREPATDVSSEVPAP
jgi:two-component system, chemotaxis family, protein-glutamate methylesterase/glutaminase